MAIIVQKFGGTSVADNHHLINVAKKAINFYKKGNDVVVVVSAQGDTTDELIEKAEKVGNLISSREMDMLLSVGEQISASLLAMTIENMGVPAISLTGWQAGFETTSDYGDAKIKNINTERINLELSKKKIVVITGFQGMNSKGDITTLGRGGSDTSAVAIAGAMKADVCKIYTDVDGVYTADPRIVSCARKLENISYEEMFKLSSLGAQVLNDVSIETAKKYGVEVEVLSSMKPDTKGTIIKNKSLKDINQISGIAVKKDMVKVMISGVRETKKLRDEIFPYLISGKFIKDPDLRLTGQNADEFLVFLSEESKINSLVKVLEDLLKDYEKAEIFYEKNKSEISVVNLSESLNINIASIVFETLNEENINIEMAVCDNSRISVVVDDENIYRCVNSIHNKIFEEDYLI